MILLDAIIGCAGQVLLILVKYVASLLLRVSLLTRADYHGHHWLLLLLSTAG